MKTQKTLCQWAVTCLALTTWTISARAQTTTNQDLTGLPYGEHTVGFRFIESYDPSRNAILEQGNAQARITPIYFWYPAIAGTQSSVTLRDYLHFWGRETNYKYPEDSLAYFARKNYRNTFFWTMDHSNFDRLYEAELSTRAYEGLEPKGGKHPLVLISHGPVINWQFIAEYLASHGYCVAIAPVAGTYNKRMEEGASGVATEHRDMEYMMGQLIDLPIIDRERIATMGYSIGTLSATALAAKFPSIGAVVSLDGVIADPNEGDLIDGMVYYDEHLLEADVLHFSGGFPYSSFYDRIHRMAFANRYLIEMTGMRHNDFIGQGFLDELGLETTDPHSPTFKETYGQVAQYVEQFLDAALMDEHDRLLSLKDGSPDHPTIVSEQYLPGISKPYHYEQLIQLVLNEDFDALFELYDSIKSLDIKAFSYREFHDLGAQMLYTGHNEQALRWLQGFMESYPQSAKAHYLAGVAMRRLERKEPAIEYLEKAEQKLPEDPWLSKGQVKVYSERTERFLKGLREAN